MPSVVPGPGNELLSVNDMLLSLPTKGLLAFSVDPALASGEESSARAILLRVTRDEQVLKNWKFNYAEEVSYTADANGFMILGSAAASRVARLELHSSNPSKPAGEFAIVERLDHTAGLDGGNGDNNWKIYNTTAKTFVWAVGQVLKVNVTYYRSIDEVPEGFRLYVTAMAKIDFLTANRATEDQKRDAGKALERAMERVNNDQLLRSGLQSATDPQQHQTILDNDDFRRLFGR